MRILSPLLAENILPTDVLPDPWHWMGLTLKELLAMLGAVALVTLILVIWAVYFRKSPRRQSHHHWHHHSHDSTSSAGSQNQNDADSDASAETRHRRKRKRRREHRPRNPTLAETGGLPPIRSERPPDILP